MILKKSSLPKEIQKENELRYTPVGISSENTVKLCASLNQILVETIVLQDMYKKHHWQIFGVTFYQLHLLFDKHYEEQAELVDLIAERIETIGGVVVAMPQDVAERTQIQRAPKGAESIDAQITRLLNAHEQVIKLTRESIDLTNQLKDWGSNDLLMSDVLRTNEKQYWFVSSHLFKNQLTAD